MKDLIIIGAGPGGYELAIEAYKNGLSVCIIEKNKLGGTCLNCGCIPTKTYYQYAKVLRQSKKLFNNNININIENILLNKNKIVEDLNKGIETMLHGIEVIYGEAKLISNTNVEVNGTIIEGKNIVIATGSSSKIIPIKGIDNPKVLSSTELLTLNSIPKRLAIIGGGVIGIEMATIFASFGSEVCIIEAMDTILPTIDKEIVRRFQAFLKQQGIKIITKTKVLEINEEIITDTTSIPYDYILLSIGRSPNTNGLNLDQIGVDYSNKGITVDKNFKTNIDNIYAIGDVTGKNMLAHYATYSGYKVLNNIVNKSDNINFEYVPSCIFSFPEIASVGLTEEKCKEMNLEYQVIKKMYRSNGKAQAIQEVDGFIKVITQNDVIIGAHIIGEEANILISELNVLMNKNITLDEAKDFIHPHPTLSEIVASVYKK